jgi:hypothetical protein
MILYNLIFESLRRKQEGKKDAGWNGSRYSVNLIRLYFLHACSLTYSCLP